MTKRKVEMIPISKIEEIETKNPGYKIIFVQKMSDAYNGDYILVIYEK